MKITIFLFTLLIGTSTLAANVCPNTQTLVNYGGTSKALAPIYESIKSEIDQNVKSKLNDLATYILKSEVAGVYTKGRNTTNGSIDLGYSFNVNFVYERVTSEDLATIENVIFAQEYKIDKLGRIEYGDCTIKYSGVIEIKNDDTDLPIMKIQVGNTIKFAPIDESIIYSP